MKTLIKTLRFPLLLVLACVAVNLQARELGLTQWVTPYGVKVLFMSAKEIPMLDLSVDVDAGSRWDPADRAGLASLTQAMLAKGVKAVGAAPALNEVQINETIADLAIQPGGTTSFDRSTLTIRMLADRDVREKTATLLSRVIAAPAFDPVILEREKQRVIAGIRESMTQPQSIATKALWKSVFGAHPYGRETTPESVAAISAEQLSTFHAQYWQPQRMRVTIVGALSESEARALVDQIFAAFSRTAAVPISPIAQRPAPMQPMPAVRQAIAHPATQSHLWLGLQGIARDDPDFFALTVGNYILGGGGFVSRLTEEVREKRGLSYSVFSAFQPLAQPGPFMIALQTQNAKAPEALQVVETTLQRFLKDGPSSKELKAAKQNLIGGFALRVDTNRKLLDNLAQINYYDMPLDYLQTWSDKIAAVTVQDIRRAMARTLKPENLSVVVVAGPQGFTP